MYDFLQSYIPTVIQCAFVAYILNNIDRQDMYNRLAWYGAKSCAIVDKSNRILRKTIKSLGIIRDRHTFSFIDSNNVEKVAHLYTNEITESNVESIKTHIVPTTKSIIYHSPEDYNNKCDLVTYNSLDNIDLSYSKSDVKLYSIAITWKKKQKCCC